MKAAISPASKDRERRAAARATSTPPNSEVADAFDEMAELLAIHGDNQFRVRAYQRAAQVCAAYLRRIAADAASPPGAST